MHCDVPGAEGVIASALALYNGFPPVCERSVHVMVKRATVTRVATGSYLVCGRMLVDREDDLVFASTRSGITITNLAPDVWEIAVPSVEFDEPTIGDVEDALSLVLTEHWRALGWQPIHAGCIVSPRGTGMLLCAPSGGGKSTLTVALVRAGWRTLGDDKLLLHNITRDMHALSPTFNVHPHAASWFPELAALSHLPRYSAWTEKRRLRVEDFWPGALKPAATPKRVVRVVRDESIATWSLRSLPAQQTLSVILSQVVVPTDVRVARAVITTISRLASDVTGIELRVGPHAYDDQIAESLETALA